MLYSQVKRQPYYSEENHQNYCVPSYFSTLYFHIFSIPDLDIKLRTGMDDLRTILRLMV
jgi:hypothetical protein